MLATHTRIGNLDREVVLKSVSSARDATTNEKVLTFSTLDTVWAERLFSKSNEQYESNQQVAKNIVRYRIRYRTDVTEQMRLIDGSDTFEISGIEPDKARNSTLILTCEKRDNG